MGTVRLLEHGMKVIILMIKLIIFKGKGDIRNCEAFEHGMKVIILMIKLIIFKGKGDIRNCYGAVSMV